ncbi:CHAT domain-containing protein [Acaryochloris marina NIES-2412]|uniref:CHAT domain-containing protein n=1 Tax=Acaryochloris marina TaxID=155978 RepID=UPI004058F7C7
MSTATEKPWQWVKEGILTVSSKRSLGNLLKQLTGRSLTWVVIVHRIIPQGEERAKTDYYVYGVKDIQQQILGRGINPKSPLRDAFKLQDIGTSFPIRQRADWDGLTTYHLFLFEPLWETPYGRAVVLDAWDQVVAVGTKYYQQAFFYGPQQHTRLYDPLDTHRSFPGDEDEDSTPNDRVTLSAQTQREIQIGEIGLIDFKLEVAEEANPLDAAITTTLPDSDEARIRVVASTESEAVTILGARVKTVGLPSPNLPICGDFELEALQAGQARIALSFRMGGTELGVITLVTEGVAVPPRPERAMGMARAMNRDPADDTALDLLVECKNEGNRIWYEYKLNSEALGLNYLTVKSRPLLAENDSSDHTLITYVQRLYQRVTPELRSGVEVQRFKNRLAAIGVEMGNELFAPEVTKVLWPLRDKIKLIKLTSWEPYIPWELIRLQHPDTLEVDDRFLCEYGLIRSEQGQSSPRELSLKDWAYLAADYPCGSMKSVGEEVSYFREDLPQAGIQPQAIPPDFDPLMEALRTAAFDVLHISCHGEAEHDWIGNSRLIIGDKSCSGGTRLITVDPTDFKYEIQSSKGFRERRPIVFLNGCETARIGANLTTWGGWPKVFNQVGASVFVGTSWPVRDKPASNFSKAFYDALQSGQTLAEAATAARLEAKNAGDASWLAFKVYGNPRACKS